MDLREFTDQVAGDWVGVNRLRLMPDDDYAESAATASVRIVAGQFASFAYTWFDGDAAQDGLVVIQGPLDDLSAVWMDSWHCAPAWMTFAGRAGDGTLALEGSYPAPPGPDWGWQIHVGIHDSRPRLTMHNQVPGSDPYQVVDLDLRQRVAGG